MLSIGRLSVSRRTLLLGCGTSIAAAVYWSPDNRGLRRQAYFWSQITPVVTDYYWNFGSRSPKVQYQKWMKSGSNNNEVEDKESRQALLNEIHDRNAPKMLNILLNLRGMYIKLGQVLSVTALPLPQAYRDVFRTLQSDVPGWETFESTVQPTLERELKTDNLDDIFESIEPIPVGSASIGQAHRAVLKGGDEVVLKVQYPDAAWQVPADIDSVGNFMRACVYFGVLEEHTAKLSFDEFARQFMLELDYTAEKENLQNIYDSSTASNSPYQKWGVRVPKPYADLCTSQVIAMTYLPGTKLEDEARKQLEALGISTKGGMRDLVRDEAEIRKQAEQEVDHDDESRKDSPSLPRRLLSSTVKNVGVDNILSLVRFSQRLRAWVTQVVLSISWPFSFMQPVKDFRTSRQLIVEQSSKAQLTQSWVDALFDVHGHQIFELGLFNGDPHPGNILVDDQSLGLIDFGQCKRLTQEERSKVARLILSVANKESDDKIAACFRNLGIRTKNDSTEFLAVFARLLFDKFRPEQVDHSWHRRLHNMDRVEYFPNELAMVYRTSLLLRGLAISLQYNTSVAHQWKNYCQEAVDKFGGDEGN